MNRLDAQRVIVKYLATTGVLSEAAEEVATIFADGKQLEVKQRAIFDCDIAVPWFHVACESCDAVLPLEAIPVAIKSGEALCPNCRPITSDAFLILQTKGPEGPTPRW